MKNGKFVRLKVSSSNGEKNMKKKLTIIIILVCTILIEVLFSHLYAMHFSVETLRKLSASEVQSIYFRKFLIFDCSNLILSIIIFFVVNRTNKSKLRSLGIAICFFIIVSVIVRFLILML